MAKRTSEGIRTAEYDGHKPTKRTYQPPADLDDMGAVIDMGLESIKENQGRQAIYPNTPQGLEAFYHRAVLYFERINEINSSKEPDTSRVFPDFEGFAIWQGISRVTLFNYEQRGGEWAEMIGIFKTLITSARKQITSAYKIPPMWEIFNLVNNSTGYQNTNQIVLSTDEAKKAQEQRQIQDRLEANNLVWDEKAGEYLPESGGEAE